jgi:hypothetical protein
MYRTVLVSLVLSLGACGGGASKPAVAPTPAPTQPDCDEMATSGDAGEAGSGVTGPGQTVDPNAQPSPAPTKAELDRREAEMGSQRLPMGPDVPPCRAKSGPPSPVPPTPPPAA